MMSNVIGADLGIFGPGALGTNATSQF